MKPKGPITYAILLCILCMGLEGYIYKYNHMDFTFNKLFKALLRVILLCLCVIYADFRIKLLFMM